MLFHDELNDKIWDIKNNNELLPEVADKLKEIAAAFIEYLEIPQDAILDMVITGSSASYNYNKYSDLDLHIIVDYDKIHDDCPLVEGYLGALKNAFNKEHDITIHGIPVELYAEKKDQGTVHNGLYSLQQGKWIDLPKKIEPTDNDAAVDAKFNEIKEMVDKCDDSEQADELLDKIYKMRKAGLATAGEFGTENLAFKKLRNAGCMDKLRELKKEHIDKQLSLESYKEGQIENNLSNIYANKDESLLENAAALQFDQYPSFINFYKAVLTDFKNNQQLKHKIPSYKLSLPADIIRHDLRKHNMQVDDWNNIFTHLNNIFIANKSSFPNSYSENNYLIGIRCNTDYYGLCISVTSNDNFIATAFKSTKNGVISYVLEKDKIDKIKKKNLNPILSQPTAKLPSDDSDSVATRDKAFNNIINDNIEKIKSIIKESFQNIMNQYIKQSILESHQETENHNDIQDLLQQLAGENFFVKSSKGNLLNVTKQNDKWFAQGKEVTRQQDKEYIEQQYKNNLKDINKTYDSLLDDLQSDFGVWDSDNLSLSEQKLLKYLLEQGVVTRTPGVPGEHDTANGTAKWIYKLSESINTSLKENAKTTGVFDNSITYKSPTEFKLRVEQARKNYDVSSEIENGTLLHLVYDKNGNHIATFNNTTGELFYDEPLDFYGRAKDEDMNEENKNSGNMVIKIKDIGNAYKIIDILEFGTKLDEYDANLEYNADEDPKFQIAVVYAKDNNLYNTATDEEFEFEDITNKANKKLIAQGIDLLGNINENIKESTEQEIASEAMGFLWDAVTAFAYDNIKTLANRYPTVEEILKDAEDLSIDGEAKAYAQDVLDSYNTKEIDEDITADDTAEVKIYSGISSDGYEYNDESYGTYVDRYYHHGITDLAKLLKGKNIKYIKGMNVFKNEQIDDEFFDRLKTKLDKAINDLDESINEENASKWPIAYDIISDIAALRHFMGSKPFDREDLEKALQAKMEKLEINLPERDIQVALDKFFEDEQDLDEDVETLTTRVDNAQKDLKDLIQKLSATQLKEELDKLIDQANAGLND